MDKEIDNTNQINNNREENSNIELIYSYTEALIKAQGESLNRLDTKLSAFLAFAGVSLRFAVDLPNEAALAQTPTWVYSTALVLKLLACGFSMLSILVCVFGLTAKMRGSVVDPEILMDDKWYWEKESYCRAFIVKTWIKTGEEYKKVGNRKGKILNLAIKIIGGAAIAFTLNTVLLTFYR